MTRPDLKLWTDIKAALRLKFGDPLSRNILSQQLNYLTRERNESLSEYLLRLKALTYRIFSKTQQEYNDANSIQLLNNLVENQAVANFQANCPPELKSMILTTNVNTLGNLEILMYRYQDAENTAKMINKIRNPSLTPHKSIPARNTFAPHFMQSQTREKPQSFNSPIQTPSTFPSKPINIQSRPVQSHFPRSSQVFGTNKPPMKNVWKPNPNNPNLRFQKSTPMSGVSFTPQKTQTQPYRNNHFFQSTGPRNFMAEELTNLEYPPEQEYLESNIETDNSTLMTPEEYIEYYNSLTQQQEDIFTPEEDSCNENFPIIASESPQPSN